MITASPLAKAQRFEEPLKSVLAKLNTSLAEHIQSKLEEDTPARLERIDNADAVDEDFYLSEDIDHYSSDSDNDAERNFRVLEEALYEQKVVRASYQPAEKRSLLNIILHPYAIFFRKSDWYLEAKSNQSENASLTFKILRFQRVMLTDETFETPADFSLSEDLASRWELFSGDPIRVTLKIAAHKAYLVTEKERHRSQEIIERCADGAVVVRYEVPKEDFTFWVLSLGDAVEVLDPPGFRAEFQEIVRPDARDIFWRFVKFHRLVAVSDVDCLNRGFSRITRMNAEKKDIRACQVDLQNYSDYFIFRGVAIFFLHIM